MPARSVADNAARVSLSEHLQDVTEALAAARTRAEVFGVVLEPALAALGAVAGAVLLVTEAGERLEIAATRGHEAGAQTLWQDGPLDGNVPAGDALGRHEALFFEHQGDLTRVYPELEARTGGVAAVATAVLPMFLDDRPLGTIILDFQEPHDFIPEEKRFLRTLASQCALALGRARSLDGLRASEARFRRMVEASPVAIAAGDLSGQLTLVNDAYLGLLGLTRAEFEAGQVDWAALTPPEYREADERAFAQALRGGVSEPYEKEMLGTRGERLPLRVVLIRYEDGGQSLVVGYLQDLRSQRAAERVLREHSAELGRQVEARTRESEAARVRAEVLASLGSALHRASTPEQVADLALDTLGPALRAQGMVLLRLDDEHLRFPARWGEPPGELLAYLARPGLRLGELRTFGRVAREGRGLYLADYRAVSGGLASLPALAGGVEPIYQPDHTLEGFLMVWRDVGLGPWQETERDLLRRAAGTLGLAFERAGAVARLTAHARQIEEESRAREAFVAFTETVGTETDIVTLAGRAVGVVQAHFPGGTGGYYEREGELWKLRTWTSNLDAQPSFIAALQAGLPGETPFIAELLRERAPIFTESWDAGHEGIDDSEDYGTVAAYPVILGEEVRGFFTMGFKTTSRWEERDRAIFRAVGHSLTLALERAEQARQLQASKDEEARRTQALSAFAELSRDLVLETNPLTLIRRTQEAVLGLLPAGWSSYFEPGEGRWHLRSHVGHANTPELQAVLEAGLPFGATPNLLIPWRSGEPHYQDEYDPASDHLAGSAAYPGATVTLPVRVGGHTCGVLGFALFTERRWSGEDRAVLETVGRQLTLALERAEQTRRLAEQNAELDARTRALEGFAELTRDLDVQSEPGRLTQQALRMVLSLLPPGVGLFYERHGGRWRATAQVGDVGSPALQAAIAAGLPVGGTPTLDRPDQRREVFFQDVYDPAQDVAPELVSHLRTTASLPVLVHGEVVGIFNVALFESRPWSAADRAVLETTVHSLGLALEGAQGVAHLAEERRKLQAANEELEAFTYSVSHDLRTPVRHIGSFNVLLRRHLGGSLDAKAARYLGIVDEAAGRMNTLIDAMLDLSRTSRLPLQVGVVDLGDLVRAVQAELEADAPERRVDWRVAALPLVTGDPPTLRQVVVNLFSNALKYTRPREVASIEVWAEDRADEWAVFVRDNGVGFDPRYADRLFGVFQRLHRFDEFEGTGVGLANVRRIVARHGGRVWASAQPGEGATFGFTLPKS